MPTEADKNTLNELAHHFPPEAIMWKPGGGGKKLAYITARHVMNRLNSVVGVRGWWDEYEVVSQPMPGVMCKLTVIIDGEPTTKWGFGGFEQMQTPDDSFKSGESNALRRAAVKFGIGHYLYNNGSVIFNDDEPGGEEVYGNQPAPRPAQPAQTQYSQPAPVSGGSGQPAPAPEPGSLPQRGGQLFKWATDLGGKAATDWIKDWGKPHNLDWDFRAWPEAAVVDAANAYLAHRNGGAPAQPAPRPAQQAPAQNSGGFPDPTDIERPSDGRMLFKLTTKTQEKTGIAFLPALNDFARNNQILGRMVDWKPEDVAKVWRYFGSLVAKQKQDGNIPAGDYFGLNGQPAPQPATPAAPYNGSARLAEIKGVVADIVSLRGEEPKDEAIFEELVMIMDDCHQGKAFSLVLTDPAMGDAVLATVKKDLEGRRLAAGGY